MMRRTQVNFNKIIRTWDGFGVNYVEVAQTRDYEADPQEYGGFSVLRETDRQAVLDMIFNEDGLKPGVIKMFLDPFHQPAPGAPYDHKTTTRWMRYFVREGLARTRAWGGDLEILTTLYGPPGWMTKQKFLRGRDLDPAFKDELGAYIAAWAGYLREEESFPVRYVGLHNEGEDWMRWPLDGSGPGEPRHDYNMYWPPEQVVDVLKRLPPILADHGLDDVGVAPGETSNWYRFAEYGYADAIADDEEALTGLELITSHGFKGAARGRWYGDWRSLGTDVLRAKKPGLHAWVTSTSWSDMDVDFVNEIRNNIYCAKVNAIIPWACIQRPGKWVGGDPNPGTAFRVYDDGHYEVLDGYHTFKQVSRAGQPGMAVAHTVSNDGRVGLIAFGANGTDNPDAFVVLNLADEPLALALDVRGSDHTRFEAARTGPGESYINLAAFELRDDTIPYEAPARSVTTFFGA